MILCIDIGNTSIHAGLFSPGGALRRKTVIPTGGRGISSYFKAHRRHIDRCVIASVVPPALEETEKALGKLGGIKLTVVGRDADAGVKNLYRYPEQVGQDRLVNARAAFDYYGGPAIVVDFGTAITIDLVNENKEYVGGVIAPGVELSMKALSEKTALLPYVKIKKPSGILGRTTEESMINGAVYGFAGLCEAIVNMIKKRTKKRCKVIATGGLSGFMSRYCRVVNIVDPQLTLKGLFLIAWGKDVQDIVQ